MAGPPRRPGLARQDSPAKPAAFTAVALLLLHAFSAAAAIYMRRYAGEYSATQAQWSFAVAAAIGGVAAWVGPPLPPAAAPLVWLATAAGLMDSRRHLSLAFERILADGPRGASISSQELMLRSAAAAFSGGALACTMLGWLSATSARAVIIKGRHPFKPVGMMLLSFLAASPIVRIPMPIPTPTCLAPMITAFISTAASVLSFPARPQRSAFHARWMALALLGGVIVKQGLRCMQCDPVPPGPAATHASMLGATELWSCELRRGGVVSVVEGPSPGSKELGLRYRLMRLDHSIMGGTWIAPHEAAGSSVYSAFVLQSAARLFVRRRDRNESDGKVPAPRLNSLVVGLGAGTVVDALRRHGFSTSKYLPTCR